MSTRSLIGIKNKDGSVTGIYCHNDGYVVGGVGETLHKYYNNEDRVRELINLGDLSSVHEHIAPIKEFDLAEYHEEDGLRKHSFDHRHGGCTVAYHRDRNEPLNLPEYKDEEEYVAAERWQSFNYLWKDGKWYVDGIELTDYILENGISVESEEE